MGPNHDLTARPAKRLDASQPLGLKVEWKVGLGSGYSQVIADGGEVFAMYSDSTHDVLVNLKASTGEESWRYIMGPTFKGRQGSMDGPLSTPSVSSNRVFGFTPGGSLFCVDRANGKQVWRRDLVAEKSAPAPEYGFTSSPLLVEDLVVINVGAPDGHSIMAFGTDTGEVVWSAGSEPAEYQSPTLVILQGRQQLMTISGLSVQGLDVSTGKVEWSYVFTDNPFSASVAHIMPVESDRFMVNSTGNVQILSIAEIGDSVQVAEVWSSNHLKGSYTIPIYHKGFVFGYNGNFLSAVDASTGERVWRSRPPGKGTMILLDDILVVWDVKGRLTLIQASGNGYKELNQLQVMDAASITNPSYAEGMIFVRSHKYLAAVKIVDETSTPMALETDNADYHAPIPVSAGNGKFGQFLGQLTSAADPAAAIDAFLSSNSFPLVEDGNLVHFTYRGEAEDLGLYLGYTWRRDADSFKRVPETDLWHLSYRLEPGGRYDYQLQRNFDNIIADPLNPNRAPSPGEVSDLTMPDWKNADYLSERPDKRGGRVESITFASDVLGNERQIDIYLPAGYDESAVEYPLVVVCDHTFAQQLGLMQRTLDNLIGESVAPCVVAFEQYPAGRQWAESFLTFREQHAQMLAQELVPHIRAHYRVLKEREALAVMGTSTGGHAAMYTALSYPELFGRVGSQSLTTLGPMTESIVDVIEEGDPKLKIYMDWCTVDMWDPGESLDIRVENQRLAAWLQQRGYEVNAREIRSGTGWGTWRNQTGPLPNTWLSWDVPSASTACAKKARPSTARARP
jgi:enterochelin esterase-like enzyme/outer membrane protein assembly factor BamB